MVVADTVSNGAWIQVRSCKFDGSVHRTWKARLAERSGSRIVLEGEFEFEVRHAILGTIERGARTREIFWNDRWYSVFQFLDDRGGIRIEYVNINLPPTLRGTDLSFIDLDVDILVRADGTYAILDEDEFQTNAALFSYPAELRTRVERTVAELTGHLKTGRFADLITHEN